MEKKKIIEWPPLEITQEAWSLFPVVISSCDFCWFFYFLHLSAYFWKGEKKNYTFSLFHMRTREQQTRSSIMNIYGIIRYTNIIHYNKSNSDNATNIYNFNCMLTVFFLFPFTVFLPSVTKSPFTLNSLCVVPFRFCFQKMIFLFSLSCFVLFGIKSFFMICF